MNLTVGDMFAGVGGIALGFEQAKFEIRWANEFDVYACETYRANFSHTLIEGDIKEVDSKTLPEVDVVTSGFPCQSFSLAGNRQGFKDPRGNLFFETARVINDLRPKAFLLENVKNLKSHDKGRTIEIIENTLNDIGYSFIPSVLSAYQHGNVPQNRERIYVVGFRKDLKFSKEFNIPKEIKLTKKIGDLLSKTSVEDKYYFKEDHKYVPMLKEVMTSRDTLYQWRRVYVRENKNNLCPTLTANMGAGGHNVPLLIDDKGYRKLTPRECFRFQGFPEHFKLPKNQANSRLYKQAGNSVTVPVIRRIASEIRKVLLSIDKGKGELS
jgi:DNA (cytosine-5)-methyltransferase 1